MRRIKSLAACLALALFTFPAHAAPPPPPADVEAAARAAADTYNIDSSLLLAIAWHESGYETDAQNGDCVGLMQISLRWNRERMERLGVTGDSIREPEHNMLVAADLLRELIDRYGDIKSALVYYGGGDAYLREYRRTGVLCGYVVEILEIYKNGGKPS